LTSLPTDINQALGTIQGRLEAKGIPGTISVVMIVKDEEKNIIEAIESFFQFADEIVINDTGSTDRTVELVKNYGSPMVKLFESKWPDGFHFGNARNMSIERATSRWIIWLDADDRIPEATADKLQILKTAPTNGAFGFLVKNTDASGLPVGAQFLQCRMFPNHDSIRFERGIHEQSIYSIARAGLHFKYIDATIIHTGYASIEEQKKKAQRNIDLSLEEPGLYESPVLMMCLADSYYILNDWYGGIEWYNRAYNYPNLREINGDIYGILPCRIACGYMALEKIDEAIEWLDRGKENKLKTGDAPFDIFPEYMFHYARCMEEKEKYSEACELYIELLGHEAKPTSQSCSIDKMKLVSINRLISLFFKMGKFDKLKELMESARVAYPKAIYSVEVQ